MSDQRTQAIGVVTPISPAVSVEEISGSSPLRLLASIMSRLNLINFALLSEADQL